MSERLTVDGSCAGDHENTEFVEKIEWDDDKQQREDICGRCNDRRNNTQHDKGMPTVLPQHWERYKIGSLEA